MNRSIALRRSASGPMDGLSGPLRIGEAKPCGMPLLHHASIAAFFSRPSAATGLKAAPAPGIEAPARLPQTCSGLGHQSPGLWSGPVFTAPPTAPRHRPAMPRVGRPSPAFTFAGDALSLLGVNGKFVAEAPIPAGLATCPVRPFLVSATRPCVMQQQPATPRHTTDESPLAKYCVSPVIDQVPEIVLPCLQFGSQSLNGIRRHCHAATPTRADAVPYPPLRLRHEQPLRRINVPDEPVALRHRKPPDPAVLLVLELPFVEQRPQFYAEFPRLLRRALQRRLVASLASNARPLRPMHLVRHCDRLLPVSRTEPRHPPFHRALWAFNLKPILPFASLKKRPALRQHRQLGAQSVEVFCLRRKPPPVAMSNGVGNLFPLGRGRELARFPVDQAHPQPTLRHGPGTPLVGRIDESGYLPSFQLAFQFHAELMDAPCGRRDIAPCGVDHIGREF